MASETGATPQQIERAAFKYFKNPNLTADDYGEYAERAMGEAMRFASHLVRPDERIVRADDLRAALSALDELPDIDAYNVIKARLRAAIGTPTAPVCPRCGERTYESPRTGRTCVRNECGWRERE